MAARVFTFRDKSNNAAHEGDEHDLGRHKVRELLMEPCDPNDKDQTRKQDSKADNNPNETTNLLLDNRRLLLATSRQLVDATHQGIVTLQDDNTDA